MIMSGSYSQNSMTEDNLNRTTCYPLVVLKDCWNPPLSLSSIATATATATAAAKKKKERKKR